MSNTAEAISQRPKHREDEQEAEPDGHRERHRAAVGHDVAHTQSANTLTDIAAANPTSARSTGTRLDHAPYARPTTMTTTGVDDVHPRQRGDVVPSEEHGVAGAVEEHEGGAEQERHPHQPTDAVHLVGSHAEQGRHPAAAAVNAPGPIV